MFCSRSKLFDALKVFLKAFLEKLILEKKSADDKNTRKIPSMQRVKETLLHVQFSSIFDSMHFFPRWRQNAEKICTSKGDYWINSDSLQLRPFLKMGTSLKGKKLLPQGANSFLLEQFLMA